MSAQELSVARSEPEVVTTADEGGSAFRFLPWALFVMALGAAVFFFLLWRGTQSDAAREGDVKATGTAFLEALTTFDASTIEQDAEEIRAFATASFAEEVEEFFGQDAQDAIKAAKASSEGEVRSLYVQEMQGEEASLFAVVAQTIDNKSEDPHTDVLRIEVRMVETTSGWKVASVDIIRTASQAA